MNAFDPQSVENALCEMLKTRNFDQNRIKVLISQLNKKIAEYPKFSPIYNVFNCLQNDFINEHGYTLYEYLKENDYNLPIDIYKEYDELLTAKNLSIRFSILIKSKILALNPFQKGTLYYYFCELFNFLKSNRYNIFITGDTSFRQSLGTNDVVFIVKDDIIFGFATANNNWNKYPMMPVFKDLDTEICSAFNRSPCTMKIRNDFVMDIIDNKPHNIIAWKLFTDIPLPNSLSNEISKFISFIIDEMRQLHIKNVNLFFDIFEAVYSIAKTVSICSIADLIQIINQKKNQFVEYKSVNPQFILHILKYYRDKKNVFYSQSQKYCIFDELKNIPLPQNPADEPDIELMKAIAHYSYISRLIEKSRSGFELYVLDFPHLIRPNVKLPKQLEDLKFNTEGYTNIDKAAAEILYNSLRNHLNLMFFDLLKMKLTKSNFKIENFVKYLLQNYPHDMNIVLPRQDFKLFQQNSQKMFPFIDKIFEDPKSLYEYCKTRTNDEKELEKLYQICSCFENENKIEITFDDNAATKALKALNISQNAINELLTLAKKQNGKAIPVAALLIAALTKPVQKLSIIKLGKSNQSTEQLPKPSKEGISIEKSKKDSISIQRSDSEKIYDSFDIAGLLSPYIDSIQAPLKKPDPTDLVYEKEALFNLIKTVQPHLNFGEEKTSKYTIIFVKSNRVKVINVYSRKFFDFRPSKDNFLFKLDPYDNKDAFIFEKGTPEFFVITLPQIISKKTVVPFDKLREIVDKFISKNHKVTLDDVYEQKQANKTEQKPKEEKIKIEQKPKDEKITIEQKPKNVLEQFPDILQSPNAKIINYRPENIPDILYIYEIDNKIISSFSQLSIKLADISVKQVSPLVINILTNIKNPVIKVNNMLVGGVVQENLIKVFINVFNLPVGTSSVQGTLMINDFSIPFNIEITKVASNYKFIRTEGNTISLSVLGPNQQLPALNPRMITSSTPIKVTTYDYNLKPIPHRIETAKPEDEDLAPKIETNDDKTESEMFLKSNLPFFTVYLDNNLYSSYLMNFMVYDKPFFFLYFDPMLMKFTEATKIFAGILTYRHSFYINSVLDDPDDNIHIKLKWSDSLLVKDFGRSGNVWHVDLLFTRYTTQNGKIEFEIKSEKELIKTITVDVVPANITFETRGKDLCFRWSDEHLNNCPAQYFIEHKKIWVEFKANEFVKIPPYKFIVCTPFTYAWTSFGEKNIETYISYSFKNVFPPHITNYCFFVVDENATPLIVMEYEYDPTTMSKLCIRLCDEPYNPNEDREMWNNVWVPVEENVDYMRNILSKINNFDKMRKIVSMMMTYIHFEKKGGWTDLTTARELQDFLIGVFKIRLEKLRDMKYQVRLPMKLELIFKAQDFVNNKVTFKPHLLRSYDQIIEESEKQLREFQASPIPESNAVEDTIKISSEEISFCKFDDIKVTSLTETSLEFGKYIYNMENIGQIVIPSYIGDINQYVEQWTVLCMKLPFIIKLTNSAERNSRLLSYVFTFNDIITQNLNLSQSIRPDILYRFVFAFNILKKQFNIDSDNFVFDVLQMPQEMKHMQPNQGQFLQQPMMQNYPAYPNQQAPNVSNQYYQHSYPQNVYGMNYPNQYAQQASNQIQTPNFGQMQNPVQAPNFGQPPSPVQTPNFGQPPSPVQVPNFGQMLPQSQDQEPSTDGFDGFGFGQYL